MSGTALSIAHFVPSFGFGGAERIAVTISNTLKERGHSVRMIAPRGGAAERGMQKELDGEVEGPLASTPDHATRGDAARCALDGAIRMRHADVIHAHLPWPDRIGMTLCARGRRPCVLTFQLLPEKIASRGPDLLFGGGTRQDRLLSLAERVAPLVLVGLTRADCAMLREAFPGTTVEQVANAPLPVVMGEPRTLPFGPGLRMLAVGRLDAQKGFDDLFRALAREPMQSQAWSLCVIGEGEERKPLEKLIGELGLGERVKLVGALPAAQLMPQAELFVTSSRYEGMPLVLLEALRAGLPVVASSIPAHREVLEGMESALLPESHEEWSAVFARFTENRGLLDELSRAAKTRAEHYTVAGQVSAYSAIYERLVRSKER
jgi:glycosyltransferase involved in cell wall biosynthesis